MIMTIPYNATPKKMVDDIVEFLIKNKQKIGDIEVV
jgi:hypothetical protein